MRHILSLASCSFVLLAVAGCSSSEQSADILQSIRDWTPQISWGSTGSGTFNYPIYADNQMQIPAKTVSGAIIVGDAWDAAWYQPLHSHITAAGWESYVNLNIDGFAESRWGYRQVKDGQAQFLILSVIGSDCATSGIEWGTCKSHALNAFLSEPLLPSRFVKS